jgi:hypothetical protein
MYFEIYSKCISVELWLINCRIEISWVHYNWKTSGHVLSLVNCKNKFLGKSNFTVCTAQTFEPAMIR